MSILYVDSTYDITLGILDEKFSWLHFQKYSGKKASMILQKEAFHLLQNHNIKARDIKAVVSIAGPGFYTGLRLSEGLADVFEFFKIPHYSFYSYDIPKMCGVAEGVWLTKAYRGEYFFHHWNEKEDKNTLITTHELEAKLAEINNLFIHTESAIDQHASDLVKDYRTTQDLLKKYPGEIFKNILDKKLKRESFYFRAPEDEFRVST